MKLDQEQQEVLDIFDHQLSHKALREPLPTEKLERVSSWGEATSTMSYVYRPSTIARLRNVLETAERSQRSVGLRGAGNSYGDASLNAENITLDMRRMNRILEWDPSSGRIQVEPGVTVAQLWQYALEDGWWPAVVPGTSKPTIGGCAGMNVHGKNAWKEGTIGDHIDEFELMLPSGDILTCNRVQNHDLFRAAIGGIGMLGVFTSITLSLKRVYSGLLDVEALVSANLGEMIQQFEELSPSSDYLVGWIDAFAEGKSVGRGQVHKANYVLPGVDPQPSQSLRLSYQHLPDTILGVVPRSALWRFMRPFGNNLGWRFVNLGKYLTSRQGHGAKYQQAHVAFHFLLDYAPNWKKAYGPGGLVQYQSFIPEKNARDAFQEMLHLCRRRGLPNYLTVLKRHRRDEFLISHGVDGYSMAMDFRVTNKRKARILKLAEELDEIVLEAGGRFYFAKDSTLTPEVVNAYLGKETVDKFRLLKSRCDPRGLLQTNLWRRVIGQ